MKLVRKTVLVTGGSRGIGRLIALECAAKGADIVLWARNEQLLEQVTVQIILRGGRAR